MLAPWVVEALKEGSLAKYGQFTGPAVHFKLHEDAERPPPVKVQRQLSLFAQLPEREGGKGVKMGYGRPVGDSILRLMWTRGVTTSTYEEQTPQPTCFAPNDDHTFVARRMSS